MPVIASDEILIEYIVNTDALKRAAAQVDNLTRDTKLNVGIDERQSRTLIDRLRQIIPFQKQIEDNNKKNERSFLGLSGALGQVAKAFTGIFVVNSLKNLGSAAIGAAKDFEQTAV